MKRSVMLLLVLVLATASLLATAAYNSASVTQAAQLKVVNTNQALLTLEDTWPWLNWSNAIGYKDHTVTLKNGELFIEFGKGINGGTGAAEFYGLQPHSTYQWNPLFTLRNKSAETVNVTLKAEGAFAQYITFGTCTQATVNNPTWGVKGAELNIGDVSPETHSGMQNIRTICVKIDLPENVSVSQEALLGSIVVSAVAK